jgi:prevent-host-death family protein
MAYTVHQAKTHLSRLIKEAEAGEEVIVTRGTKPVAKLVAIRPPEPDGRRTLAGAYRGKISWTADAFDPMTDEELIECGLGYMLDAPLVPPPTKPTE